MSSSDFYIFLPSEVSRDPARRNTLSQYRTTLPSPLDLNGEWEVSLVEIMYTKSWLSFPVSEEIGFDFFTITKDGFFIDSARSARLIYTVPEGNYSVEELFDVIDKGLQGTPFGDKTIYPRLFFDNKKNIARVKPGFHTGDRSLAIVPKFGPLLTGILGFTERYETYLSSILFDSLYVGEREVDLEGGRRSIFVYSNIIEPQVVGNTHAPLLRIVPIDPHVPLGSHISCSFDNTYYFPLSRNFVTSIEITLRDITGSLIPFRSGRVVSTLHFRQKQRKE